MSSKKSKAMLVGLHSARGSAIGATSGLIGATLYNMAMRPDREEAGNNLRKGLLYGAGLGLASTVPTGAKVLFSKKPIMK